MLDNHVIVRDDLLGFSMKDPLHERLGFEFDISNKKMTLLQKLITNLLSFWKKTFAVKCIKAVCGDSARKTKHQ